MDPTVDIFRTSVIADQHGSARVAGIAELVEEAVRLVGAPGGRPASPAEVERPCGARRCYAQMRHCIGDLAGVS
jgi:hypothetical protein